MSYPYIPLEIDLEIDDNTENVPLDIGEAFFVYENDYNNLTNKPSINGEELVGDIDITDLFDIDAQPTEGSENAVSSGGVYDALQGKQDSLTIDVQPVEDSGNPISSGGVYDALQGKQDVLTIDAQPTPDSTNPVQSGGVAAALADKQDDVGIPEPNGSDNGKVLSVSGGEYALVTPAAELFAVTYGTTTFASIAAAVADGKLPFCNYDAQYYYFLGISAEYAYFVANGGNTMFAIYVDNADNWDDASADLQERLQFDAAPTEDSANPVTSGGVFTALAGKQNTLTIDAQPTLDSTNPVQSGGTASALALKAPLNSPDLTGTPTAPTPTSGDNSTKIATTAFVEGEIARTVSGVYRPAGSVAFAQLPALTAAHVGEVYDITDAFVTTADFVEGAGISYPAGTDVAIVEPSEGVYKYDAMSGMVDLSNYYTDTEVDTLLAGKQDTLTIETAPVDDSGNPISSGAVYTALQGKQDNLTIDASPTNESTNPVQSGGVYTALAGKQATLTFDNAPTNGSNNPVKSGGIYTALQGKQDALPTPSSADNGKFLRVVNGAYALATVPEAAGEEF